MLSVIVLSSLFLVNSSPVPAPTQQITKRYKDIIPLPQNDDGQPLFTQLQPRLAVVEGCVPFAAVDSQGFVSSGIGPPKVKTMFDQLRPHPSCKHNLGQVYTRNLTVNRETGIMYSWFFPEQRVDNNEEPYKYAWQSMIVWLRSNLEPYLISYTGGTDSKWLTDSKWAMEDGHIRIAKYEEQLWTDTDERPRRHKSGFQPLIAWDAIPEVAQLQLNWFDFGPSPQQRCRINNHHFVQEMHDAYVPPPMPSFIPPPSSSSSDK